jgi:hypothetical protein
LSYVHLKVSFEGKIWLIGYWIRIRKTKIYIEIGAKCDEDHLFIGFIIERTTEYEGNNDEDFDDYREEEPFDYSFDFTIMVGKF